MTYLVNKSILTIIYLLYYLHKKLNKINSQIKNLKVKNDIFNRTEGVLGPCLLFSSIITLNFAAGALNIDKK